MLFNREGKIIMNTILKNIFISSCLIISINGYCFDASNINIANEKTKNISIVNNGKVFIDDQKEKINVVLVTVDEYGNEIKKRQQISRSKNSIAACDSQCANAELDNPTIESISVLEPIEGFSINGSN